MGQYRGVVRSSHPCTAQNAASLSATEHNFLRSLFSTFLRHKSHLRPEGKFLSRRSHFHPWDASAVEFLLRQHIGYGGQRAPPPHWDRLKRARGRIPS